MSLEMLHELNRNTMQYIIDEQKKELEEMDKELGKVVTRNYPEMKKAYMQPYCHTRLCRSNSLTCLGILTTYFIC
ncbi:MAG: hypothetical protein PUF12_13080 [Thermoflexaceae bacterium]|nr:hypothetical protein [Thermoflexaceae bacterium]